MREITRPCVPPPLGLIQLAAVSEVDYKVSNGKASTRDVTNIEMTIPDGVATKMQVYAGFRFLYVEENRFPVFLPWGQSFHLGAIAPRALRSVRPHGPERQQEN